MVAPSQPPASLRGGCEYACALGVSPIIGKQHTHRQTTKQDETPEPRCCEKKKTTYESDQKDNFGNETNQPLLANGDESKLLETSESWEPVMSRRKQSNPKPIKPDEEEEEATEPAKVETAEEEEETGQKSCNSELSSEEEEEKEEGNTREDGDKKEKHKRKQKGGGLTPPAKGDNQESDGSSKSTNPFGCPMCSQVLKSQHEFTLHIRLHNSEESATTHTCSLCGKTLSSSSSLDRHMLVHSGERPFKCSRCAMAFTTNGNMHRHMRTHHGEEDVASDEGRTPVKRQGSPDTPSPSKRMVVAKEVTDNVAPDNSEVQNEESSPSIAKDATPITNDAAGASDREEEQLNCPVCNKTFLCKYGLQTHLETHPDFVLRCQDCSLTFRNFRGLNRHRYLMHIKKASDANSAPVGFHDLTFVDFSAEKFTLIAKAYCERHTRRPSSAFHMFECPQCKKAFPCSSALKMHLSFNHSEQTPTACENCDSAFADKKQVFLHRLHHLSVETCFQADEVSDNLSQVPLSKKENFLAVLGLQANESEPSMPRLAEEPYENAAYFTHGMPSSRPDKNGPTSSSYHTSDGEDFADIQSILSLTSSPSLLPVMRNSPVVATSPSPRRGLAINPESPATADSATASPELPADVTEQAATSTSHTLNGLPKSRFPCKLCTLVFPNLRALKGHNRSHLGMSPYRCNMCAYTSIDKSTLLRHLRTHNGERPYLCTLCQYAFTTKANCERHMRKRHGKLTKQEIRNAMQQKPQSHDPSQTLNSFYCPDTVCKYCNTDFKFYRVLRHHLRSLHSRCARKPFQCRLCQMGFSTKNNCYRHIVKQHPEAKDNINESIWTYTSNPQLEPADDDDDNDNDNGSVAMDEMPDSPEPSLSPGPPLLDPMPPISQTPGTDSDLSSVEALVHWSTHSLADVPLQEEPLDLAVHPVDLSLKKPVDFTIRSIQPMTKDPPLPKISRATPPSHSPPPHPTPIVMQSSPFISRGISNFYNSPRPTASTPPVLELTPSPTLSLTPSPVPVIPKVHCSNSNSPTVSSEHSSPSTSATTATNLIKSPQSSGSSGGSSGSESTFKKQKQKRYRTERPFRCSYCEAGFTLRSNMERHIKQQHPEHWAVRVRGRKPASGSSPGPQSPAVSRPIMPRPIPESAPGPRPISTHVKEAISQQIRQRLANTSNEECSSIISNESPCTPCPLEPSKELNQTDTTAEFKNDEPPTLVPQETVQDLVSVSCLLDTATAQNIQEIFRESESANSESTPSTSEGQATDEKSDTKRSAYTNAPHRVSCPFCARRFPWTSSLRRHILTHTGQKPFKCPHCPLLFTTKSNCDRHLVRKHGGVASDPDLRSAPERPYRCTLCPSSAFSTPSNLRKHLQQKHGQDESRVGVWDDGIDSGASTNSTSDLDSSSANQQYNQGKDESGGNSPSANGSESATNDNCYPCHMCKEVFYNQEEYVDHLELSHEEEVPREEGDEEIADQHGSDSSMSGDHSEDENSSQAVDLTENSRVKKARDGNSL